MNNIKPGFKTSEFFIILVVMILETVAMMKNVMDPIGISGGKVLLDESYVLNGSTSNIHVNISIGVE